MEIVKCKHAKCNDKFKTLVDPIELPCGRHICKSHIDEILNETKGAIGRFKCVYCDQCHMVPIKGYAIDEKLNNLLKANKEQHDNLKNDFKNRIGVLALDLKDFYDVFNAPEQFIEGFFAKFKNQIMAKRDELIEDIHKKANDLIAKVTKYETGCKNKLVELKHDESITKETDSYLNEIINKANQIKEKFTSREILEKNNETKLREFANKGLHLKQNATSLDMRDAKLRKYFKLAGRYLKKNSAKLINYKQNLLNDRTYEYIEDDSSKFGKFRVCRIQDLILQVRVEQSGLDKSEILNPYDANSLLNVCGLGDKGKFELIYRASRDGFNHADFHQRCDNISGTITLIKSKETSNVFGGYTDAPWQNSIGFQTDSKYTSSVFSVVNNKQRVFDLRKPTLSPNCGPNLGPSFGFNHEIYIASDSNTNRLSHSIFDNNDLNFEETCRIFRQYDTMTPFKSPHSVDFTVSEIEVFAHQ